MEFTLFRRRIGVGMTPFLFEVEIDQNATGSIHFQNWRGTWMLFFRNLEHTTSSTRTHLGQTVRLFHQTRGLETRHDLASPQR